MRGFTALHCAFIVLSISSLVVSAGESPLYSRGILEFNRGDFEAAAAHFADSVRETPNDYQAHLYLGLSLFETGDYARALEAFEKACAIEPGEAECRFYAGLCLLETGDYARAVEELDSAARDPSFAPAALLYAGVAASRAGRKEEAARRLRAAMRAEGASPEIVEASLKALASLRSPLGKRLSFSCSARYEYDTNVGLIPDDSSLVDVSGKGDFRFLATSDIIVRPVLTRRFELDTEYYFAQSVHNRLGDYNLQQHSLINTAFFRLGLVQPFFGHEYDYLFLDDNKQSFLRSNAFFAGFNLPAGDRGLTQFNYRYGLDDFFYTPEARTLDRDAHNNSIGFDQYVFFGPRRSGFFRFGFYYDRNSASGDTYMYNGYALTWELYTHLLADVSLDAAARYYLRRFPRDGERDRDRRQTYDITLSRPLNEHLGVGFNYNLIVNDSGDPFFEFDRNIFTVFCTAAY